MTTQELQIRARNGREQILAHLEALAAKQQDEGYLGSLVEKTRELIEDLEQDNEALLEELREMDVGPEGREERQRQLDQANKLIRLYEEANISTPLASGFYQFALKLAYSEVGRIFPGVDQNG